MKNDTGIELSLFSLNCYLVPQLALSEDEKSNCINHEERALAIGNLASHHDIVSLQEVWGPASAKIESSFLNSHTIPSWKSTGFDFLDTARNYLLGTGGLWFAYNHNRLQLIWRESHQFSFSNTKSGKGFTFHLFKLDQDSPKQLLIISTHLDPDNKNNSQIKQLLEIRQYFIKWAYWNVVNLSISDTSVIMNGDFNIRSHSTMYNRIFEIFPEGIVDEYYDFHKGEETNTYSKKENKLVFWNENARIDYFFSITKLKINRLIEFNENENIFLESEGDYPNSEYSFERIRCVDTFVAKYHYDNPLSDHFPVIMKIVI